MWNKGRMQVSNYGVCNLASFDRRFRKWQQPVAELIASTVPGTGRYSSTVAKINVGIDINNT